LIASHGIPVVDADVLARRVVEPGTSPYAQIVSTFGNDVILKDGSRAINRARLGEIVFNDERQRKLLNAIVHPAVRREMIWEVARYWLTGHKVCVVDVPLLIEAGMWKYCSKVVVVYWYIMHSPPETSSAYAVSNVVYLYFSQTQLEGDTTAASHAS
jgi:dephospho-CoA kinase